MPILRADGAKLWVMTSDGRGGKRARVKPRNKTWTNAILENDGVSSAQPRTPLNIQ